MPNGKGFKNHDDNKTQPAKLSNRDREDQADGSYHGFTHPFNEEQKITNTKGSSYQDFGGGISDNFGEKDINIAALEKRNKEGNLVQYWTATHRTEADTNGEGPTAYNTKPIPETYKPATSNGVPDANAVQYETDIKDRNP